jgi:Domain of unknown function (DUF4440)
MPPTTDDLADADDEVWAALRHADADALEAIVDADATIDHAALGIASLAELLAELRTGRLRIEETDLERRRLRIIGELATTTVFVTVAGTSAGAPFRTRLRWINTWRLEAAWELIAASSSPPRERG